MDSSNPDETPYLVTTIGIPLYKKSYVCFSHRTEDAPIGFKHNWGADFIHYPITTTPEGKMAQA